VRPVTRDVAHADNLSPTAVDNHNRRGLSNVRVDNPPLLVVDRPARPAWQRQLHDHLQPVDVDHRRGAALPERLAEVEAAQASRRAGVREAVRVRADRHLSEQAFVRAVEDADARAATVGGEQKVVALVDQDTGDAGEIWQRAYEAVGRGVDDIDSVGAGVSDVHETPGRVHIGVVETRLVTGR
jgi:hypothetical protein